MPPRHGKSEKISKRFACWYLGKHPTEYIVQAGYAESIALTHSRQARDIFISPAMYQLFPDLSYRPETPGQEAIIPERQAAHEWGTKQGGSYYAVGIGGGLTGRGFNVGIIDDPVKDAEEADSATYRERVWNWYTQVFRTRADPDAAIIIVMCMTGDTTVTMGDGTSKPLSEVRLGDIVATYENGKLTTSVVKNWKNQGLDNIFTIRMKSGIISKANERHPFLVDHGGNLEWIKTKNLKVGDKIVSATPNRMVTIGESGAVYFAQNQGVENLQSVKDIAFHTTTKHFGLVGTDRHQSIPSRVVLPGCVTDMASMLTNTMRSLFSKMVSALSAVIHLARTLEPIGVGSCALTTTMAQGKLEDCSVMTATSWLDTERQAKSYYSPLNTFEIGSDTIEEILEAGSETVFDIQVERTGNFIANGLVSHNTRWHENDLVGRLLEQAKKNPNADQWEMLHFPADKNGKALWPARYPFKALMTLKANDNRVYEALYQGHPTVQQGQLIKREWWRYYKVLPAFSRIIHSWDTAFKDKTLNDYSVCTVWGEAHNGYYLIDLFRGKPQFPELKIAAQSMAKRDKPNAVLVEDKASGQSLVQELQRTTLPILPVKVDSNKAARVNACSPIIQAGKVFLPEDAPWLFDYIEEFAAFPNGKHDDQVDSTTQALNFLREEPEVDAIIIYDTMEAVSELEI